MSGEMVKVGDEVELTVTGKVAAADGYDGCHRIEAASGHEHHLYIGCGVFTLKDGEDRYGVTAKILEAPFEPGKAYEDGDGEVFIRRADCTWIDQDGRARLSSYLTKPIRLLA